MLIYVYVCPRKPEEGTVPLELELWVWVLKSKLGDFGRAVNYLYN